MPGEIDRDFIPSSYSRIVARVVGLHERELPLLLEGTGLPRRILLPGDETMISGSQQLQVLDNGRHLLDAPEFGLRLGRQLQPSAFGPLGYLALSSPDLVTALESLAAFLPARIPFIHMTVKIDDRWLESTMRIRLPATADQQRMLHECFVLVVQAFAESVLGESVADGRIELSHRRPDYHRVYPQYLHSPVRFRRPATVYRLPAGRAHTPNASGSPDSYGQAYRLCQQLLQQAPASALSSGDQVRRLLLSSAPGSLSEDDVARSMFISKRTLARRLEREGSSYRGIRDKLLAELAARHLRESSHSVEAIALMLGYNDAAAFRKAFRRWYGQSPGSFRQPGR